MPNTFSRNAAYYSKAGGGNSQVGDVFKLSGRLPKSPIFARSLILSFVELISQSSLAVRFTAKNGGYPGDVKI